MEYIDVTVEDIELANHLAHQVLGRTLDELPPQTRRMLSQLQETIAAECTKNNITQNDYRFTRAQLRDVVGWTYDQVRVHLERLINMEYVLVHRGKRGQSFEYELLYRGEGQAGDLFLMGLIDTSLLKKSTEKAGTKQSLGGKSTEFGVALGGHWGGNGAGVVGAEIAKNTEKNSVQIDLVDEVSKNALLEKINGDTSYTHSILRESNTSLLVASSSTESNNHIEV